ncbi:SVSP family protein [Theileria parva strain Muguga]|uniref:Theileria-specific sub-telomeric protein, SVSP family member n=1 Tax=Theileria parva TaxID=5875 RepID=Q4N3N5_THEPA|nr:SVSP family protein [Theileria parva strain Muguga]EAN33238.1 SVSP family protein [Theileria parva strain Muguga]|eukprot:XP_765521.1 hypothetical protein [Theileria parva strain Muguga]
MDICVAYTYSIILILIGYAKCADKQDNLQPSATGDGYDSDDDENFNVIVSGVESLLMEDEDSQTAGETVVSGIVMQHGLGPITDQAYGTPQQPILQPFQYQHYVPPAPIPQDPAPTHYYGPIGSPVPIPPSQLVTQIPGQMEPRLRLPVTTMYPPYGQSSDIPMHHGIGVPSQIYPQPPVTYPYHQPFFHPRPRLTPPFGFRPMLPRHPVPHPNFPVYQPPQAPTEPPYKTEESEKPEEEGAEEGAVGGAAGGGDDDDEGDEKVKPSEPVKICEKITFMKKTPEGVLSEMIDEDYILVLQSENIKKFKLKVPLEVLMCEEEIVYVQKSDHPQCTLLTHNKKELCFILNCDDHFILLKRGKNNWKVKKHQIPEGVIFYTTTAQGIEVQMSSQHYYIDLTASGSIKFTFLSGIPCTKVTDRGEVVWDMNNFLEKPYQICYSSRRRIVFYFTTSIIILGKKGGQYKILRIYDNLNKHQDF